MLDTSSNALVAMASELSEAEERERACTGPGRWQQLRTMGDAKSLLHYVFSIAVDSRYIFLNVSEFYCLVSKLLLISIFKSTPSLSEIPARHANTSLSMICLAFAHLHVGAHECFVCEPRSGLFWCLEISFMLNNLVVNT